MVGGPVIIKEAGSKQFKVRLDKDDERALELEMERNGYGNKASAMRGLVRGLRMEHHHLGLLTADLRLPSVLVELVDRMEYHRRKCGESCPHAMQEYAFVVDRYRVTFVPRKAPQEVPHDLSKAVRNPYSPSKRREENEQ